MTDIKAMNAISAYNNAANIASPVAGAVDGGAKNIGPDFSEMLSQSLSDVADTTKGAETKTINSLSGKATLDETALSLTNAELSIKTLLGIRDRVIDAYKTISQMSI